MYKRTKKYTFEIEDMQGPYDQRFLFNSRARKNFYQDDAIRFFSINNKKTWFLQLKAVKNYTQNGRSRSALLRMLL